MAECINKDFISCLTPCLGQDAHVESTLRKRLVFRDTVPDEVKLELMVTMHNLYTYKKSIFILNKDWYTAKLCFNFNVRVKINTLILQAYLTQSLFLICLLLFCNFYEAKVPQV